MNAGRFYRLDPLYSDNLVEYELVRFDFPTSHDTLVGRFMIHSYFRQSRQLQDLSISEDIILMTDVEQDGTISFDVLNWRNGHFGRVRTGIISVSRRYSFLLILRLHLFSQTINTTSI